MKRPRDVQFTRAALQGNGFVGWLSFADARASTACPTTGGIYVVAYSEGNPATFAASSCGGWFKGKDPTVSAKTLAANWVDDAEIVYIGKADQLRRRIRQFADFGAGKAIGHWGGRLIWQLPEPTRLRIAWKETPDELPASAEAKLIADFRKAYLKLPFANAPHLLGR